MAFACLSCLESREHGGMSRPAYVQWPAYVPSDSRGLCCLLQDFITCAMLSLAMNNDRAIESDFLFLIYDVAQLVRRHADKRARIHGMTRAQWAVLARLEREPGITQSRLAMLTDVEPITIGRLVDRLEANGLIERRPDPDDRRIWRLSLTPKSAVPLRQIAAFRRELHDEMGDGLEAPDLAVLVQCLQRMRVNLTKRRTAKLRATAT
jgi:MarR family transcriptional regulator, transcriptional regulator for hemolysin